MADLFRSEHRGDALVLWNCNAARRNALSPEYYDGVIHGLRRAAEALDVSAVVLAGEGAFFCAGGTLALGAAPALRCFLLNVSAPVLCWGR